MQACFADPIDLALLIWLGASGAVSFLAMSIDKARALDRQWRIPEVSLYAISLVGGFWGVILGAFVFRHKTSKPVFLLVILGSLVLWALILSEIGFVHYLRTCAITLA
jgi:uncharacterized membrane protein YsdA (DUF1294 family)